MANLVLQMALHFKRTKESEKKGHGKSSIFDGATWYLRFYGPTYCNQYRVIDPTPEEIAYLEAIREQPNTEE